MKTDIVGRYDLELKCNGDRTFINFWDSAHGNDVCVQFKDGKFFQFIDTEEEIEHKEFDLETQNSMGQKEITFEDFILQIQTSIKEGGDYYAH